jgi:hypothetical protein
MLAMGSRIEAVIYDAPASPAGLPPGARAVGRLVAVIETPEGRDPSPPGLTGSRLGDALALIAACAVAAVRWHGREEAGLEALAGQFGLAAALTPAPGN